MSKPSISVPLFQQEKSYSCLPACVRMVLAFLGSTYTEAELRALLKTRMGGTSPAKLMLELPRLGFDAAIWSSSFHELRNFISQDIPCIVSVWTGHLGYWDAETMHAIVVTGLGEESVIVQDPAFADAPKEIPLSEFLEAWAVSDQTMITLQRLPG